MNIATNLFLAYIIYFASMYIKLAFSKEKRESHQSNRVGIERLRNIAYKTKEEQKEFLDLKYPKSPPFVWSFKNVGIMIFKLAIMVGLFIGCRYLWRTYIPFQFALWQVFIIMIVLPIILNKILKKYNLQQDDLLVYFR